MSNPRGVDLSHFQPTVDFGTIKGAGVTFVGLKATDGIQTDLTFPDRRARSQAVGFDRTLIYHFFRPGIDPALQANHYKAVVGDLVAKEIAVVDVETASGWDAMSQQQGVDAVLEYIETLKGLLDLPNGVMIYGSIGWLKGQFGPQLSKLAGLPLWVARYGVTTPGDVSPWGHWTVWQSSETGRVPGIGGLVDTDFWNGPIS